MTSPGAALAAMRPTRGFVCAWCGKAFTAKDTRAKFCSNRCRQADKYQRMKAAFDANQVNKALRAQAELLAPFDPRED